MDEIFGDMLYGFNYAPWTNPVGKKEKEKESTFTKQSENFQSQKAVGLFLGIITQGHIIHWNNS